MDFGYNTIGGTETADSQPIGCKHTAPASGTLQSISLYAGSFSSTQFRAAVYANNGGIPGAKLAESASAVTVTTAPAWRTIVMPSLAIVNGTVYWLAFFAQNADARVFYDTGTTGQTAADSGETYPTWPDPLDAFFSLDRVYSIYATFDTGPGEVNQTVVSMPVFPRWMARLRG